MKKIFIIISIFFYLGNGYASNKVEILKKFNKIDNISFNFIQTINGKDEKGECTILYPKKIYCDYNKSNKILVSNGKSLVIKTKSSYYRYPLKKTPLNLILDKNFLINKIYSLEENILDNSYINYSIKENENKIDIFFSLYSLLSFKI